TRVDGREVAANVRDGRVTVVEVEGQRVELEQEDLLLDARSPVGYAAKEDRGYLAALSTAVTPELRLEGLARDVIRLVQNARKEAGLEVSDRIALELRAEGDLHEALRRHGDGVASEVLATEFSVVGTLAGELTQEPGVHAEAHAVEGLTLELRLRKVTGAPA